MSLVLYLALAETAFGMAFLQCFVPRSALGQGFGKTVSAIVFFCQLGAWIGMRRLLPPVRDEALEAAWAAGLVSLLFWFAYFVAFNYDNRSLHNGLAVAATLAQLAGLVAVARVLANHFGSHLFRDAFDFVPKTEALFISLVFGALASALCLGSVTMAMLIGHWYLVESNLSIRWLQSFCLVFLLSLALKAGSMGLSFYLGVVADPYGLRGFLDRAVVANNMLFQLRLLVGLAIPTALGVMAWRAAAIRSTQSSTGILFPAQIVVFLAEMVGAAMIRGLSGLYF